MKWFSNMKIGKKIIAAFLVVSVIAGAMGVFGVYNLMSLEQSSTKMYEKMTVPLHYMAVISTDFQKIGIAVRNAVNESTPEGVKKYSDEIDTLKAEISSMSTQFESLILSEDMQQAYDSFKATRVEYIARLDEALKLAKENNDSQALVLMSDTGAGGKAAATEQEAIDKMMQMKVDDASGAAQGNVNQANSTILIMAIIVVFAVAVSLGLGIIISRNISNPLKKALAMIQEMSKGHLKNRLDMKTKDEVGLMAEAMDSFADDLQKDVVDVIQKIAAGDADMTITPYDDQDEIRPALKSTVETIRNILSETNDLIEASVNGSLSTRAKADKFEGGWRDLVSGINNVLDATIAPVQEAAEVLDEMARGNLQKRVEGNYRGDHAKIKDALNTTLDSLSGYVFEISSVLNEMANSNLALEIKNEYLGDFAQIKEALNSIISNMNVVLQDISSAADQVASASTQVSAGSQAQSQGATEQASSLEELTASIEQVAAQTNQNAENADEANRLATDAREDAITGNEHMQNMLRSMEEINESSASISKIIKVIDDIAFQTNILALNAAVEAARAGQYGKGFAVVAEEVRNLASRSAQAAKETTDLIEGSITKASAGTKIANQTADSLKKIVEGVTKASSLVGNIATASKEQSSAITQINRAVMQVSDVVQSSSATAEEGAAASEELSSQAETLKTMLKNFKLKKSKSALKNEEITPEMMQILKDVLQKEKAKTIVVDLDGQGKISEGKKPTENEKKPKIKIDLNENQDSKY